MPSMEMPADDAKPDVRGKRLAILRGASAVFARDGYSRASIDQIAAASGASTRTLYNHFGDKAGLFRDVIQASAEQVAAAQLILVEKHLHKIVDLETDLIEFGVEWVTPTDQFAEHFAIVRQIQADAAHIPADVLSAWQEAGPSRVRRAFAARLAEIAKVGLLDVADADQAVVHFIRLITPESPPSLYAAPPTTKQIRRQVTSGVHVFLHGYSASRAR